MVERTTSLPSNRASVICAIPMLPRQERFVDAYILTGNATEAAIKAGYSKKNARFSASEILTNPNVAAAVAEKRRKLAEKAEFTTIDVLKRWVTIATAN